MNLNKMQEMIRLNLLSAELVGDFRLNPFVVIKVGQLEWLSLVCVNGGSKPQWLNQYFDVSV